MWSRIVVCFIAGFAGSTCDKGGPDSLNRYCEAVRSRSRACDRIADGCEGYHCNDLCVERGHAAAEISDTCGDAWVEIYECLAKASCEGLDEWAASFSTDSVDYPCGDLEVKFHATCPGVPLYPADAVKDP